MNLYFLRHGTGSDPGEDGLPKDLPDADRPLSLKGREKLWHTTEAMRTLELELQAVVTSPLLRARQTAHAVTESLRLRRKLIFLDHLAPNGNPKLLIEHINGLGPRVKNILLVGHEPYLSRLISLLVSGGTAAALDLKKGGLARLKIEEQLRFGRCAELSWLLGPAQLRLLRTR